MRLLARVGPLLALAVTLELWLMHLTRLPREGYYRAVILAGLADRLASASPASILALLAIGLGVGASLRHRSLGAHWDDFEHGTRIRWLAAVVTAILAWVAATYPYNFYFDRGHDLDRLLLLVLTPLVVWRPALILPFLLVLLPILWQFSHPIGGFSWAAPMLLIRVLFLCAAFWLAHTLTRRVRTADFLFLLCCLVAAHYWVSGFGKLRLGWLANDRIAFLLPATYANGWLGFLEPETIGALTTALLALNAPMKLATLLVEAGALFALWRLTALRALLLGWIALHGAIFLVTGICFWHWVILDVAILLLFVGQRIPDVPIFTRHHFLASLLLIGGGALWFRPTELAWLDARVSYTYRVEARTENGRTLHLPPRFFAPYDYQFTLGNFRYLADAPHLPITWGATARRDLAAALGSATSPEQVLALEAAMGRNAFDTGRSEEFDRFLLTFLGSWNEQRAAFRWWAPLEAPPLLWTFARGTPPDGSERITQVVVYQVVSLFDDERYLEIRKRPVRVLDLPAREPPAPRGRHPRGSRTD